MVRQVRTSMLKFVTSEYNAWEVFVAGVGAVFVWLFGDLQFTVLLVSVMVFFDLVTGVVQSFVRGSFESKILLKTAWKLLGYGILLSMLHLIFIRYLPEVCVPGNPDVHVMPEVLTEPLKVFPFIIAILIVLRESASIIENLVKARILPKALARRIGRVFKSVRDTLEADEPLEPSG